MQDRCPCCGCIAWTSAYDGMMAKCDMCGELRPHPNPKQGLSTMEDTNPKDGIGIRKWRQYAVVPCSFVWGMGVAMLEGALKYGRHNYRVAGVRASVYVDAAKGHIDQFWEGEDLDPDSQLHHILKAGASLAVLYDGIAYENWVDDRPPKMNLDAFRKEMQQAVDTVFDKYPDAVPPYIEKEASE